MMTMAPPLQGQLIYFERKIMPGHKKEKLWQQMLLLMISMVLQLVLVEKILLSEHQNLILQMAPLMKVQFIYTKGSTLLGLM